MGFSYIYSTKALAMKLLLFSNSTNPGEEYLSGTLPFIKGFLGAGRQKGIFIPYAAVTFSFDEYEGRVAEKFASLHHEIASVHRLSNPQEAIEKADFIVVGGGNTFQLLKMLQDNELLTSIRKRVMDGTPYIGWSAGSNLACPGIYTSNDMPIVQPKDFKALNFINYQINPHYTDYVQPGHGGETRDARIIEFCAANPKAVVVGIPEGTAIRVEGNQSLLMGTKSAVIFRDGAEKRWVNPGDYLSLF